MRTTESCGACGAEWSLEGDCAEVTVAREELVSGFRVEHSACELEDEGDVEGEADDEGGDGEGLVSFLSDAMRRKLHHDYEATARSWQEYVGDPCLDPGCGLRSGHPPTGSCAGVESEPVGVQQAVSAFQHAGERIAEAQAGFIARRSRHDGPMWGPWSGAALLGVEGCEHLDVRHVASERGGVACFTCGRLFGHLRDGHFTAFNPTPEDEHRGFAHGGFVGPRSSDSSPVKVAPGHLMTISSPEGVPASLVGRIEEVSRRYEGEPWNERTESMLRAEIGQLLPDGLVLWEVTEREGDFGVRVHVEIREDVIDAEVGDEEIVVDANGVQVWERGDETLEPRSCPVCSSVGSGRGMARHITTQHGWKVLDGLRRPERFVSPLEVITAGNTWCRAVEVLGDAGMDDKGVTVMLQRLREAGLEVVAQQGAARVPS